MASRWAYEALAVKQFKDNEFEKVFYKIDGIESELDYHQAHFLPTIMNNYYEELYDKVKSKDDSVKATIGKEWEMVKYGVNYLSVYLDNEGVEGIDSIDIYTAKKKPIRNIKKYFKKANDEVSELFQSTFESKETLTDSLKTAYLELYLSDKYAKEIESFTSEDQIDSLVQANEGLRDSLYLMAKNAYTNSYLNDLMKNAYADKKILVNDNNTLEQVIDPIFKKPSSNFRAHFYAPVKKVFGKEIDTFYFNLGVIWLMTIILYFTLYFEMFKKSLNLFGSK